MSMARQSQGSAPRVDEKQAPARVRPNPEYTWVRRDETSVAMPYSALSFCRMVSVNEFRALLKSERPEDIVNDLLFRGVPYVFSARPADYGLLLRSLAQSLQVPAEDMTLVGSGRTGFSLDPAQFGKPFGDHSDLDVVVVSPRLFDSVWLDIYRCRLPDRALTASVARARAEHRTTVFYGRVVPHQLFRVTPTAGRWKRAFAGIARYPELATHEAHGMLFRSWEHATGYYSHGLTRLRGQ